MRWPVLPAACLALSVLFFALLLMWRTVGACSINARTLSVGLGFLDVPLTDGFLHMRFSTTAPADPTPLSFAIVRPIAAGGSGGLPDGRYYPNRDPSVVALGPGVGASFVGRILLRPRSYNARWLMAGYPARTWSVVAEVWAAMAEVAPWFNPAGFVSGDRNLRAAADRIGPAGAAPLSYV
jgi:hypothetical protein